MHRRGGMPRARSMLATESGAARAGPDRQETDMPRKTPLTNDGPIFKGARRPLDDWESTRRQAEREAEKRRR